MPSEHMPYLVATSIGDEDGVPLNLSPHLEGGVVLSDNYISPSATMTVLPYSNWQWATVCASESLAALRRGVQAALFQLGRVPRFHQTDHSTAATHQISRDAADRTFNEEYKAVMRHLGMEPRTTAVGAKEQNGDVEASHRALKQRLEQALLVRGSRDFADQAEYERFITGVTRKANAGRGPRVAEDIEAMRPLVVERLPEYTELVVPVAATSTIRVKGCGYSVPSRLIGARVRVHVYEHRIEVYFADKLELACDRLAMPTPLVDEWIAYCLGGARRPTRASPRGRMSTTFCAETQRRAGPSPSS